MNKANILVGIICAFAFITTIGTAVVLWEPESKCDVELLQEESRMRQDGYEQWIFNVVGDEDGC